MVKKLSHTAKHTPIEVKPEKPFTAEQYEFVKDGLRALSNTVANASSEINQKYNDLQEIVSLKEVAPKSAQRALAEQKGINRQLQTTNRINDKASPERTTLSENQKHIETAISLRQLLDKGITRLNKTPWRAATNLHCKMRYDDDHIIVQKNEHVGGAKEAHRALRLITQDQYATHWDKAHLASLGALTQLNPEAARQASQDLFYTLYEPKAFVKTARSVIQSSTGNPDDESTLQELERTLQTALQATTTEIDRLGNALKALRKCADLVDAKETKKLEDQCDAAIGRRAEMQKLLQQDAGKIRDQLSDWNDTVSKTFKPSGTLEERKNILAKLVYQVLAGVTVNREAELAPVNALVEAGLINRNKVLNVERLLRLADPKTQAAEHKTILLEHDQKISADGALAFPWSKRLATAIGPQTEALIEAGTNAAKRHKVQIG